MTKAAPAVDATLALLRMRSAQAAGASTAAQTEIDRDSLRTLSWHRLIAFASSHFVLQALAAPLKSVAAVDQVPSDVRDFLDAFHEANVDRNGHLLRALCDITQALNSKGVVPCLLKGAAILLTDDGTGPASWRFMSDLDLLVREEDLDSSVAAIKALGFVTADDTYDPLLEAHYPPLISPCGTYSVELHTRLFGLDDFGLSPRAVIAEAASHAQSGAELLVPSMSHRIAHLLIHAQLHNRNHAIHRIVLKDVLDLSMLQQPNSTPINWTVLLAGFRDPGHREAVTALLEVWRRITGVPQIAGVSPAAHAWADRAIARLYWPRWRTLFSVPGDVLRMESYRARTEDGHLRRRLKLLTDPARVRDVTSRWAGKQRQRVWG